jgi:hypothetical protein
MFESRKATLPGSHPGIAPAAIQDYSAEYVEKVQWTLVCCADAHYALKVIDTFFVYVFNQEWGSGSKALDLVETCGFAPLPLCERQIVVAEKQA